MLRGLALDHIRVERALREEVHRAHRAGLLLEHVDELRADRLALLLRVGHSGKTGEEALGGVDVDKVEAEVALEDGADALRFLAAQQAVVDEDAGQLVAGSPRWTSRAVTAESTPPESAQMTRPSPTWSRMRCTVSETKLPGVHEPDTPHTW